MITQVISFIHDTGFGHGHKARVMIESFGSIYVGTVDYVGEKEGKHDLGRIKNYVLENKISGIEAIKEIRKIFHYSLVEAKEMVDAWREESKKLSDNGYDN